MKMSFMCLIGAILISSVGIAQEKDGKTVKQVEFIIDSLPGTSPELISKSKEWIGKSFKQGEKVITSQNDNTIVGHYNESVNVGSTLVYFDHMITLDFKDNRVRVRIWTMETSNSVAASDFFYPEGKQPKKIYKDWLATLYKQAVDLSVSYAKYIKAKKEEW